MDENEDKTLQEELSDHVCDLVAQLETMEPTSDEYAIVESAVIKLTEVLVKMDEIQMKYGNEVDKRNAEKALKKLELEAAEKSAEYERKLRALELAEQKRQHNIEMGLKIAGIGVSALTTAAFVGTAWVQTRANYVDNIYDVSSASRMILTAIGKLVNPSTPK
jgi:hypothetical protein